MPDRQYAVLGPLPSGVETRAFLGCELAAGLPKRDAPVVVVWLPEDVTKESKQVARLQRETAQATKLLHPNIIRVHGLECFEEGWARVVDYCDAEPLSRVLALAREKGTKISPSIAARIVADICDGVNFAHEHGLSSIAGRPVVHGGIRPDTILCNFTGRTIVTGYAASVLAPAIQQGDALGPKAAYLAPEQVIGGKATASQSTDIYAIGAVLYELLAGKAPFAGADDLEGAILTSDPDAPPSEGIGGKLAEVAKKAMAKRGAQRFATVAALRSQLLAALDDEPAATDAQVAELINDLIPAASPERRKRNELLASASDPDAVTVLSRPAKAPPGVDAAAFAVARGESEPAAGSAADEPDSAPTPPPAVVDAGSADARPPVGRISTPPPPPADAAQAGTVTDVRAYRATSITATMDDEPTSAAEPPPPAPAPKPEMPPFPGPAPVSSPPAAAASSSSSRAPRSREEPTFVDGGVVRVAPDRAKTVRAEVPPGSPNVITNGQQLPSFPPLASAAVENTSRIPGRGTSGARQSARPLAEPMNDDDSPAARGPIPRAPIREDSITAFRKDAGDSSRAVLFVVLALAAAFLIAIFALPKKPPEGLVEGPERHKLPKELVEAALRSVPEEAPPADPMHPEDVGQPELVAPGKPGESGATVVEPPKMGILSIASEPEVDVYNGATSLGRTPVSTKLNPGKYKLRFTDRDKMINIYKEYTIPSGGDVQDNVKLGQSTLWVDAPAGAQIFLNGRAFARAPMEPASIWEGRYHLKVTFEGKSWTQWFDAPPGRKIEYHPDLKSTN